VKPFEGVKIIDLSTVIAASSAARILADQGAEVIKVETLGGDLHRVQGVILGVRADKDENPVFDLENANKTFIALDLKNSAGKKILFKLLKDADVLITNYREDALSRLGLTYDDLSREFPGLVYGHINAYGEKGEEAQKPGYDIIAYFGRTGLGLDTGTSENYPLVNLGGMGDHPTGVALAQGVASIGWSRCTPSRAVWYKPTLGCRRHYRAAARRGSWPAGAQGPQLGRRDTGGGCPDHQYRGYASGLV